MDLTEIVNLIHVRQYLANTMGNPVLDRKTVSEMNNLLLLIDKKIVHILTYDGKFKEYVGYGELKQVIKDAATITNIKSGLKK